MGAQQNIHAMQGVTVQFLQVDPVADGAQVVSQVQGASRLHPGQHALPDAGPLPLRQWRYTTHAFQVCSRRTHKPEL